MDEKGHCFHATPLCYDGVESIHAHLHDEECWQREGRKCLFGRDDP